MDKGLLAELALAVPALLISFTVHEFAHAWMATRLGDPTPEQDGRLTLSPVPHIDLVGTLLLPILMLSTSGMLFGWAKPVRFTPTRFTRRWPMRRSTALVAMAGPMSNILLAIASMLVIRLLVGLDIQPFGPQTDEMLRGFAVHMVGLNVLLAAFNLLPLPPLDGSYLLPASMDGVKAFLSRYSLFIFVGLFIVPLGSLGTLGGLILQPLMQFIGYVVYQISFAGAA